MSDRRTSTMVMQGDPSNMPMPKMGRRESRRMSQMPGLPPGLPGMGPRESLGSGNRRESMMMGPNMGRRESRRMSQMPGMGGGMDRRASRRMSQMPMGRRDSSMAHRQSVFGMQGNYEFDPTNRMNKRESSVFYQGEFDEEMRRRQVDQRRKAVANDSKEARFEKEQRVAQRNEELSYNERVKRVIAKWKMREVQQMFLSWKRYARTQSQSAQSGG